MPSQLCWGAKSVDVQGVDYSASIEGFLEGGDPAGSQTMQVTSSSNVLIQTPIDGSEFSSLTSAKGHDDSNDNKAMPRNQDRDVGLLARRATST